MSEWMLCGRDGCGCVQANHVGPLNDGYCASIGCECEEFVLVVAPSPEGGEEVEAKWTLLSAIYDRDAPTVLDTLSPVSAGVPVVQEPSELRPYLCVIAACNSTGKCQRSEHCYRSSAGTQQDANACDEMDVYPRVTQQDSGEFEKLLDEFESATVDAEWAKDSEPAADVVRAIDRRTTARAAVVSAYRRQAGELALAHVKTSVANRLVEMNWSDGNEEIAILKRDAERLDAIESGIVEVMPVVGNIAKRGSWAAYRPGDHHTDIMPTLREAIDAALAASTTGNEP